MDNTATASILQDKIGRAIDNGKASNQETLAKIEREGNLLNDFIAPLGVDGGGTSVVNFHSNGTLKMNVGDDQYNLHSHAISQAGEKLKIPTRYIRDLGTGNEQWERDLAAKILNEHTANTGRKRVLIREIGGEVRGILSDKYRRLNTGKIFAEFISAVRDQGAVIYKAFADDTRSYIETLFPQVVPIETVKNGIVNVTFGARISNSDFGDGAMELKAFITNVACLNGMTRDNLLRQIHLGGKIPDNILISEETYKSDTQTTALLVNDIVKQVYSRDHMMAQAEQIMAASATEVDTDKEILKLSKAGLLKGEVEQVKTCLMDGKAEDGVVGESSLWKLSQAVTAVARDSEGRRRLELEDMGGALLDRAKLYK